MPEDTTTVEVKHETYRALDIRRDIGESFDDVIRRLIGSTGPGVGEIKPDPDIKSETEPLDDVPAGATCSHYDIIESESCGADATHLHRVWYGEDDPSEMYLCEKHATGESSK